MKKPGKGSVYRKVDRDKYNQNYDRIFMTKKCTKCGKKYPKTKEYFIPSKRYKDGFGSWCRECKNTVSRIWCKKNPKKRSKTRKKYHKTFRGHLSRLLSNIKQRCNNPNNPDYKYYGGRGIKCKFKSGKDFADYVLNELQIDPRGLDVDRIDNDGNYEKGNIQFVTRAENNKNKKRWRKNGKTDLFCPICNELLDKWRKYYVCKNVKCLGFNNLLKGIKNEVNTL